MYYHLLAIFLVMSTSLGCQQILCNNFKERIKLSHLVATGEITDTFSATSFQMTLECLLKDSGTQPSAKINITQASNSLDGRCFINHFTKGERYLVFLRYTNPFFHPQSQEEEPSKISEIITMCGLGVVSKVPKGITVSSSCPDIQSRTCTRTAPSATTSRHKKTPPDHRKSNHISVVTGNDKHKGGSLKVTKIHNTRTTLALQPSAVTSQPNVIVNRDDLKSNRASQQHKTSALYITWCITWQIMCLLFCTAG